MSVTYENEEEKSVSAKKRQRNIACCLCWKRRYTRGELGRVRICLVFLGLIWFGILTIHPGISCAKSYPTYMSEGTRDAKYQKKYIRLKVISATSKEIKLKIVNRGDQAFLYTELDLTIKKKSQGKWKKIKYKKDAKFHKCLERVEAKDSKTVTIKWKEYYHADQFGKGKYKIIWMADRKFQIS